MKQRYTRSYKNIICINCEKKGHMFKDCKNPINSYGILAYKNIKKFSKEKLPIGYETKFLLVQRKDTIGYIDFIRGKYDSNDYKNYELLIQEMTSYEKIKLLTFKFDSLWNLLWKNKNSRIYLNDYEDAKNKFNNIDVYSMIKNTESKWENQEWCVPKGRRGNKESYIDCSIREFMEETGYNRCEFVLRLDIDSITETFYGSNGTPYKHTYLIAEILTDRLPIVDQSNTLQSGEIRCLKWFNFRDCINIFRSYETTKRNIIYQAKNLLFNTNSIY